MLLTGSTSLPACKVATLCNFANALADSPVNPQLETFRPGVLQA